MIAWEHRSWVVKLRTIIDLVFAAAMFLGGIGGLIISDGNGLYLIATILGCWLGLLRACGCLYCGSWRTKVRYFNSSPQVTRTCNKCHNEWDISTYRKREDY